MQTVSITTNRVCKVFKIFDVGDPQVDTQSAPVDNRSEGGPSGPEDAKGMEGATDT